MKLLSWKYRLYFTLIVLLFSQCGKLDWNLPKVQQNQNSNHFKLSITTTNPFNITKESVTGGGTIISNGGVPIIQSGIIISSSQTPSLNDGLIYVNTNGRDSGSFVITISNLGPGITFYLRAFAINSVDTAYGNPIGFTTYAHNIGDAFGGGIVFYVDGTGLHGLIAAASDQNSGIVWGGLSVPISTDTVIGSGATNTNAIIAAQGSGSYAASICRNYNGGGFNDWFLPSLDELGMLYKNKLTVGGFSNSNYWSSSQNDIYHAWSIWFGGGGSYSDYATYFQPVRAIRSY